MKVTKVYLDDVLLYLATADEYGEDGEIVDVHAAAVPSHLQKQIGELVTIRLAYEDCDACRVDWMRFHSVTESLDFDAGVIMRFVER